MPVLARIKRFIRERFSNDIVRTLRKEVRQDVPMSLQASENTLLLTLSHLSKRISARILLNMSDYRAASLLSEMYVTHLGTYVCSYQLHQGLAPPVVSTSRLHATRGRKTWGTLIVPERRDGRLVCSSVTFDCDVRHIHSNNFVLASALFSIPSGLGAC
jgi:hypothetical protein